VQGVEEDEDADVEGHDHVRPSQSALRMWLSIATFMSRLGELTRRDDGKSTREAAMSDR